MASDALECDVCCNVFSEENCPRSLPCFHTFCGPCIDGIIATQKKTCPTCKEEFTATSAKQLQTRGQKRSHLGFTKEFEGKMNKDSINEFREAETKRLQEMKDILANIKSLSETRESFIVTNKGIEGFMERLQEIKLSNENHLDTIDHNIKWLKNRMSLLVQEEGKTQDTDVELETVTNFTSIGAVMDEKEEVLEEGQEKVKKMKELHEKERKSGEIMKGIMKMRIRLGNLAEEMKSLGVEALEMSVVKVIKGKQMVAPVRVKPRNQVRLSHFAEGDVPPKSLIVEHEAMMTTSLRRAFLDLAVGETFLSRIVIRVMDEGNLALNFLHVCAGDLGPSYANSRLSGVGRKGEAGERINMGGRQESVMKVDWNKEEKREIYESTPWKAGEVRGFLSDKSASAYYIVTRDEPNLNLNFCFGIVEEGLDALRDAISQYPHIKTVRIVDCGLMFSL